MAKANPATRFRYQVIAGDRVFLFHAGGHIKTLTGRPAVQFLVKADSVDEAGLQLQLAKATGNFKRRNEKAAKCKRSQT